MASDAMTEDVPFRGVDGSRRSKLESTASLINRIHAGDESAQEQLMARHLPALRRWAHGRVPHYARHLADTDDVVQKTLLRTLLKVNDIEPRHQGAFFAYLRQALRWEIGNQVRAAKHRQSQEPVDEPVATAASPLEEAVGRERLRAYEEALDQLAPRQKEAVIMRLELGMTYEEIAEVIEAPSWNAARMVVSRALVNVSESMDA